MIDAKPNRVQREFLTKAEKSDFSKPVPFKWVTIALFEWALIISAMVIAYRVDTILAYFLAILFIGNRQHALSVLAHDGVHFVISSNKKVNDTVANIFSCLPLMMTVSGYRKTHSVHHGYLETQQDPARLSMDNHPKDWTFPMSKKHMFFMLLRDLMGASVLSILDLFRYVGDIPKKKKNEYLALFAVHILAFLVLAMLGLWHIYVVLWVLPLFTVAVFCFRLRAIGEHSVGDYQFKYNRDEVDPMMTTRSARHNPIITFFFFPYNVSFHLEHHLYSGVPCFKLERLNRRLNSNFEFKDKAEQTIGLKQLFSALVE